MKKLLGPEFSLDAKDSKDTIAAMLRWNLNLMTIQKRKYKRDYL
jgi:hypothetical protein